MNLLIHSFQVLNTLSCMVLTAVYADVGGHFNLVIGLLVFRRRRLKRFIIYVDNGQQYMRALQRKFVKLHRAYNLIISVDLYILNNTLRFTLFAIDNF